MESQVNLQPADYAVTAVMLLIPLGIGVFFAVRDSKRATRDEYLLGGRRMTMFPVALSIFVTFQSAIALMGTPTEIYTYGPMMVTIFFGFSLSYVFGYFTTVPLMYPLHLTSIYEYLELRFRSQVVRFAFVSIGMLQTICYMAIALLTPGLGLQAAAGIPLWMSVVIVGIIGTVYTAIGGIKSVVWTDAFQAFLMYAGPIMIIIRGSIAVGGGGKVWDIASAGGRTDFSNSSFDPRERHTWLGTLVGGLFMWLVNTVNQSTLLRISAMKTLKAAKRSYLLNIPILLGFCGLLYGCALSIYAYFVNLGCDPYDGGFITNRNQLPPYFVLHSMSDLPGISGLYMAALFSGALSSISSGINALAANTVEDILKRPLSKVKESTVTLVIKAIVCLYGFLIIAFAYAVKSIKGPVTQMTMSVSGACGGPIFGVFLLASSVPWANKYGALGGGFAALAVNIWMAIGNQMFGRKSRILPPPPTDQCFPNSTAALLVGEITTSVSFHNTTVYPPFTSVLQSAATSNSTESGNDFGFFLYDISYEWYGFTGAILSFTVGLIVSFCTRRYVRSPTNPKLIFPILRRLWSLPEIHHSAADDSNLEATKNIMMSTAKMQDFKNKEISLDINSDEDGMQVHERLIHG